MFNDAHSLLRLPVGEFNRCWLGNHLDLCRLWNSQWIAFKLWSNAALLN